MESVNIRQARERFRELIDGVEQGEIHAITRRGKKVAILVPCPPEGYRLPDLTEFRAAIEARIAKGTSLSEAVLELRENERF